MAKTKEPIYAIEVYCTKCGQHLMESLRITRKQLLVNWDDAVFKACSICCEKCGAVPPVINRLMIRNYATKTELEPRFVLPKPNYDMVEDARRKLGIS